ncbi:ImmA/IrrE family metallo-endopeptidase [Rhizobium mayense]|uniref:ImmA/IrrE family metallo-endopeptidase n=1 Tax=Rhizobium mayense TaxID=1312184 RepID=UPI000DDCAE6B
MRMIPDYRLVKRKARELLEEAGVEHPPVNPISMAREHGLNVKFVSFSGDFAQVSGFYDPDEEAIYINKNESPLRQTFTIAHELGHALLHKEWAASDGYKVFWRDPERNNDDPHEKEANAFAAHLLVPRNLLDQYYRNLSESDLSKLFAVSVPAIKNRLAFEYGL